LTHPASNEIEYTREEIKFKTSMIDTKSNKPTLSNGIIAATALMLCATVIVAYAQTPIITMPIAQSVGQIQPECTQEEISGIE
jgi:predicted hotdog family 3-hydroxylacyl-ACP dehydratase